MGSFEDRSELPQAPSAPTPVIEMEAVEVFVPDLRSGWTGLKLLVREITWTVREGEHWVVLGPNGAGKSTLVSLAAARRHPSRGAVTVLGGRLGRVDVRELHPRIGLFDWRLGPPAFLDVVTVVVTGLSGTIQARTEGYDASAHMGAREVLALVDGLELSERRFGTLSRGEQARVMIARAVVGAPELLVLDEPAAGLDLPGREDLVRVLGRLAEEKPSLATVVVAHLLEEVPPTMTHALLLSEGRLVAQGRVEDVLGEDQLSACFGRRVVVDRRHGRWSAVATGSVTGPSKS